MLKKLRNKLKSISTAQKEIAVKAGLREATISDFLREKIALNGDTIDKLLKSNNINIFFDSKLIETQFVIINKKKYKVSDFYKGTQILLCFGAADSCTQAIVCEKKNKSIHLLIF